MRIKINMLILSSATGLLGWLLYLYQHDILLIRLNSSNKKHVAETVAMQKKSVKLFFWKNDRWQKEDCDLIWSDDKAEALNALIVRWLTVLEEENILNKKITLQLTSITTNNQALISFDRNLFNKEQSTIEKLMFIEGMLKSIRENSIKIQALHILVDHKPLVDYHLDFSRAWPLSGFIEQ